MSTASEEYVVRESARARRVSLRVSVERGLVVVVPRGFDRRLIADIVAEKREWIERQMRRVAERRAFLAAHPSLAEAFPRRIALLAVGEVWRVSYGRKRGAEGVRLSEGPAGELRLTGRTGDRDAVGAALRGWARRRARHHLGPWTARVARELDAPYARLSVRAQRTRWGSYSSRGTLSLNYRLVFLPPALVRYVLVHELCHARAMDHSRAFWALVEGAEPGYRERRAALCTAWQYVPVWAAPTA